jgi:hypothetical protein
MRPIDRALDYENSLRSGHGRVRSKTDSIPRLRDRGFSFWRPVAPIQQVLCEVRSLSKTGPLGLDARLSHLDRFR